MEVLSVAGLHKNRNIIKPKNDLYQSLAFKINRRKKQDRYVPGNTGPVKYSKKAIDFLSGDTISLSYDKDLRDNILDKFDSIRSSPGLFNQCMTRAMISSQSEYPHNLTFLMEETIAKYHGMKRSIFYKSGFNANLSFIGCIASTKDFIIYDEQSHRSMITGIQLSRAKQCISFKHNDISDLVNILLLIRSNPNHSDAQIIILVESLYSMHGDIAPLEDIIAECENFNAYLYVDEAHAFGVYGKNGFGFMYDLGLSSHPNVIGVLVTYSKALATTGAALLLNSDITHDYINQYSISTVFSHYLVSSTLVTIQCGYEYIMTDKIQKRRDYLVNELIQYFVKQCKSKLPKTMVQHLSSTHMQPIVIGNDKLCQKIMKKLWKENITITCIHYPIVPKHFSMIRVWLHNHNTNEQIDTLLNNITKYI